MTARLSARRLTRDYRLWAMLPSDVKALVVADDQGRVSTVARPIFPSGVCTRCGCTEHDPCVDALGECCSWTSKKRTLCNFCRGGVQRWKGGRR